MPTAAAVPGVGGPQATPPTAAPQALAFDQAAHRGVELSNTFTGIQLGGGATGTSTVTLGNGPISLQPQGYLRGVLIDLQTTGAANNGTANNDFPFSLLNLLRLHDTNGATMHEHSGFLNYLLNLFSGTDGNTSDLSQWPDYSSSATSPSCQWYLPVELDGNGFGALANQSAADTYKLDLVLDTPANSYSTAPSTTNPTFAINIYIDYWTIPGAADMLGRRQQQEPDFHGVAQYSYQSTGNSNSTGSGTQKIGFTGNMYRLLIMVFRGGSGTYATGGARASANVPNPFTLRYDTRDLMIGTPRENRRYWFSQLNVPTTTFLTGVLAFVWNYGKGRQLGAAGFSSWLPTLPATRFELTGTFNGGTTDYLANTVSVAETNPALRGVSPSATGYSPPVAATVPGAQ
ncbi:MAG TPA: hypothetical protein VFI54_06355 [Solirubrobacteraceae bacterium]|nr:hypothetical protein [Solirubrobacteraceae bacterium]